MESKQIASFVVRFQLAGDQCEKEKKQWRIKVTHVQKDQEQLFESIEAAMAYMKVKAENS
ncbi:hypothetical protein RCG17_07895 [Neobacillus sp. PS3-12]|uniref:hypothetical protein n=1 Tax=Neobacillus sp. PS3-12 TaxID=3070677 RepID=UPI0027E0499B|nr:hypothetical protein [Neobacillus sp. PS3-12]WML54517.1 hypothetical protein RCG17_07895 [Neobacillus sp. PS3-12]